MMTESGRWATEILGVLPELYRGLVPDHPAIKQSAVGMSEMTATRIRVAILLSSSGPMRVSDLASALGVSAPAATDLVDRMEEAGHVERIRSDQDRRVVLVSLTPATALMARDVMTLMRGRVEEVWSQLSPAEASAFLKGLRLLALALNRGKRVPVRPGP